MIPVGFEKSSIHSVCFYHFLYKTAFFATGHAMQFNALQVKNQCTELFEGTHFPFVFFAADGWVRRDKSVPFFLFRHRLIAQYLCMSIYCLCLERIATYCSGSCITSWYISLPDDDYNISFEKAFDDVGHICSKGKKIASHYCIILG
jgi:hypothetical protein